MAAMQISQVVTISPYDFELINQKFSGGGDWAPIGLSTEKWKDSINVLVRGCFKNVCFERVLMPNSRICITDVWHTYCVSYHASTCEISKESKKYQRSYWHSKEPQSYALANIWRWTGRIVEIRGVHFHQKSFCVENFAPQKGCETNF